MQVEKTSSLGSADTVCLISLLEETPLSSKGTTAIQVKEEVPQMAVAAPALDSVPSGAILPVRKDDGTPPQKKE